LEIYTIGFTKKTAEQFFESLKSHGIRRLIDVRLNNVSQLAGYTKKDDLSYFLRKLGEIDYVHNLSLAPTADMLKDYRAKRISWSEYEARFVSLLKERSVEQTLSKSLFDDPCVLLCSEPTQQRCHRRLIVEYLDSEWGNIASIPL
jgi:uncharacterized protein (DUF488 family)